MKTYIHNYAIAALILVFASCSKDDDFQTEDIGDSFSLLKSAVTKQFTINKASGALEFNYGSENACYPHFAQNRNFGTGTASHFGKIDLESAYCVDQQGRFASAWTGTITTANGDVIYFKNEDPASTCTLDENWNAHMNTILWEEPGNMPVQRAFFT